MDEQAKAVKLLQAVKVKLGTVVPRSTAGCLYNGPTQRSNLAFLNVRQSNACQPFVALQFLHMCWVSYWCWLVFSQGCCARLAPWYLTGPAGTTMMQLFSHFITFTHIICAAKFERTARWSHAFLSHLSRRRPDDNAGCLWTWGWGSNPEQPTHRNLRNFWTLESFCSATYKTFYLCRPSTYLFYLQCILEWFTSTPPLTLTSILPGQHDHTL